MGYLGIGTDLTWHGAPDCRADVDILNVDQLAPDDDDASDTENTGGKTPIEGKHGCLSPRHLHQVIGNVVTYAFVHRKRHPDQNPLVPAVGISGSYGEMLLAFYDPVLDVLIHTRPLA